MKQLVWLKSLPKSVFSFIWYLFCDGRQNESEQIVDALIGDGQQRQAVREVAENELSHHHRGRQHSARAEAANANFWRQRHLFSWRRICVDGVDSSGIERR